MSKIIKVEHKVEISVKDIIDIVLEKVDIKVKKGFSVKHSFNYSKLVINVIKNKDSTEESEPTEELMVKPADPIRGSYVNTITKKDYANIFKLIEDNDSSFRTEFLNAFGRHPGGREYKKFNELFGGIDKDE